MIVHSSHGDITIDDEGKPTEFNINTDEPGAEDDLRSISKFDLPEYEKTYGKREASYDILDLGYWYGPPETQRYEPPAEDFRKHVAGGGHTLPIHACSPWPFQQFGGMQGFNIDF